MLLGAAVAVAAGAGLLLAALAAPLRALGEPATGLQQLDLLYLDEPAPLLERLGAPPGQAFVLMVCDGCTPPRDIGAPVLVADDPEVALAYALLREDGRLGPGYALIDARGRVRYRTFDPAAAAHGDELRVLVRALT